MPANLKLELKKPSERQKHEYVNIHRRSKQII